MKLTLIELLIKGIPEGFLDILAMYIFTRCKFDKKTYIILSCLFIAITYSIRLLPINFGVNSTLSILVFIILFVMIKKVEFSKAIKASIMVMILLFISEGLNMLLLISYYGKTKAEQVLSSTPLIKSIYSIPSTLIFAVIILISYIIIFKLKKIRKNADGEISNQIGK